jgi:TRAP-type C4-dicarboxylate transport system permease small subunit
MDMLIAVSARLSRWVLVAAGIALASLGIVVICGVVMRYALNNEPPFIEQVALLLVISVAMFGAAAGVHGSGHIGLDSVAKLLPPRGQFWFSAVCEVLVMLFALLLLAGSVEMGISTHHDTIPTLGISEAFRYLPPVIASVLIVFFSIEHLLVQFIRPKMESSWN